MKKMKKRLIDLIDLANNLCLEFTDQKVEYKILDACIKNFKALQLEFSKPEQPKPETIQNISYGLDRAHQAMGSLRDTAFGKELGKLLLELNDYSKTIIAN